jgi:hypothetical protein
MAGEHKVWSRSSVTYRCTRSKGPDDAWAQATRRIGHGTGDACMQRRLASDLGRMQKYQPGIFEGMKEQPRNAGNGGDTELSKIEMK